MPRQRHKLWLGRTDNTAAPENVQLRIVQRYKGCCAGCQQRLAIGRWHLDHVIPLQDGGVNAEGNLQPLCVGCHGIKTSAEATDRAKVRAKAKAAYGINAPKQKIPSRPKAARPVRDKLPMPPPRLLYGRVGELKQPIGEGDTE